MSLPTTATQGNLGRPTAGSSRTTAVVLGIAALIAVAVLLTFFARSRPPTIGVQVMGFKVVSAAEVTLRFDVSKAYEAQATCELVAQSRDGRTVGTAAVVVGPQADHHRTTHQQATIRTSALAVTAQVESCRITRDH